MKIMIGITAMTFCLSAIAADLSKPLPGLQPKGPVNTLDMKKPMTPVSPNTGNQAKPNSGTPSIPIQQQPTAIQKPMIHNVQPPSCVNRNSVVTIIGTAFGMMQGSNRVAVNAAGSVVLAINGWSDTSITAKVIDDLRLIDGNVYPIGIQNNMGAWISNTDKQIKLCPSTKTEKSAMPGAASSATIPGTSTLPVTPTKPPTSIPATEATFVSVRLRTATLTYTGRGGGATLEPPFTPIRLRTGTLTYTGHGGGVTLEPPFTPIRLRTGTLSYTGSGAR